MKEARRHRHTLHLNKHPESSPQLHLRADCTGLGDPGTSYRAHASTDSKWEAVQRSSRPTSTLNRKEIQPLNSPSNGALTTFPEELITIHVQCPDLAVFSLSHHPHLTNSLTPSQQSRFSSQFTSPMKPSLTCQGQMRCLSVPPQASLEQLLDCKTIPSLRGIATPCSLAPITPI